MENMVYDEYEIDLREYIKVLWQGKYLILSFIIISVIVAGLVSFFLLEPVYESEAKIQLSNIDGPYSKPAKVIQLIKSNELLKPIMEELKQDYTLAELDRYIENNVGVTHIENTGIVEIKIKDGDPVTARRILERIIDRVEEDADKYYSDFITNEKKYLSRVRTSINEIEFMINTTNRDIDFILNSSIDPVAKSITLDSLHNRLETLMSQKNNLQGREKSLMKDLLIYYPFEVISIPYTPENPVAPNKKLNISIAGVLGLMLGVFIVFFREFMKEEDENSSDTFKNAG